MKNKNKLLAILALSSAFLLASCDDIYARPTKEINNQVFVEGSEVDHNEVSWLYDVLHDKESTSSDIKETLVKVLEEGLFGQFKINEKAEITITGYDDASDSAKLEFVKTHKPYWDKEVVSGTKKYEYKEPTSLTSTIKSRIDLFKEIVREKVIISLFESANAGEYKKDGYFYEIKFARSLARQSYEIGNIKDIYNMEYDGENCESFSNKVLIDNSFSTEDVTTIVSDNNNAGKPILHIGLYDEYINKEVMPTIMENLLIEQYIYDNQYTSISRSQVRQIKYVKIDADSYTVSAARNLVNAFVNNQIKNAEAGKEIDYDLLADAWKGVYSDLFVNDVANEAGQLLVSAEYKLGTPKKNDTEITMFADGKNTSEHKYYENTKYGSIIEEFAKITLNKDTTDTTTENSYTNNGNYVIEKGLELKINDLRIEDYTACKWVNKNDSSIGISDTLKTRLFDYTVMSDFNNPSYIDSNSYLVEHNGHYFIKPSVCQSNELTDTIVNKDSNTFYIIEVLEAPSQAKLTIGGENAYDNSADTNLKQEKIARQIGYTIATTDTYKTSAFQHYLEKCEIIYNDQSIYDYFNSTYPDLFK